MKNQSENVDKVFIKIKKSIMFKNWITEKNVFFSQNMFRKLGSDKNVPL